MPSLLNYKSRRHNFFSRGVFFFYHFDAVLNCFKIISRVLWLILHKNLLNTDQTGSDRDLFDKQLSQGQQVKLI